MKILVATPDTQGFRKSDFCLTRGNEPVIFVILECDKDRRNIDGSCGCKRSMTGIFSGYATTTFTVADLNLTKPQYLEMVRNLYTKWGWSDFDEFEKLVQIDVDSLLSIAEKFPIGIPLEKRGSKFQIRPISFQLLLKQLWKHIIKHPHNTLSQKTKRHLD